MPDKPDTTAGMTPEERARQTWDNLMVGTDAGYNLAVIAAAIRAAEDAANSAWLETDRERLDDARHAGQAAMRERCAALAKSFIQPPPVPGAIDTRTIHGNSRAEQIEAAILALEVE